ncbi:MAG TPA: OsmC family peroxiredoxin [Longimicrobiales bacterium]|nr:OsmC family peroxiredoxin [Longimicrobiales bacterium]
MAIFTRSAVLEWTGGVPRGSGRIEGGSQSFAVPASFPMVSGDAPGVTTPEELLAASHAVCYGIGLRSVLGRRGGSAQRVRVRATVSAEKGADGILIRSSHLDAVVEGLEGITPAQLEEIAQATEDSCTISNAIRGSVAITHAIVAAEAGDAVDKA